MEPLRERRARERRLDPDRVHIFALREMAAQLRGESEYGENGHTGVLLMRTEDMRMLLEVVQAGSSVDDHVIHGPATVQVVEGELDVEVDGASHRVAEGGVAVLPHDVSRKLTARSESAFVLSLALRH
jgi:quercetin dioxygenase-like cupin family protein